MPTAPKQLHMTSAMAAAILALPSCEEPAPTWETAQTDTAICVDQSGERVDDDRCDRSPRSGSGVGSAFLWYYLGRGSAIPYYGDRIGDRRYRAYGSYAPRVGAVYARAPASTRIASRGGFGSSARRYGVSGS